jgi:hypothetical protein
MLQQLLGLKKIAKTSIQLMVAGSSLPFLIQVRWWS